MQVSELDLAQLARILIRRLPWLAAAGIVGAVAAGLAGLASKPAPEYSAESTVRYEKSSTPMGVFLESVSWTISDEIQTQAAVITSLPLLAEASRRIGDAPGDIGEKELQNDPNRIAFLKNLQDRVTANRRNDTNLIDITAKLPDPKKVVDLVNNIALVYKKANAEEKNQRVRSARTFIENQLRDTEKRLGIAEEKLRIFREKSQVFDPGSNVERNLREEEKLRLRAQELQTALEWINQGKIDGISLMNIEMSDAESKELGDKKIELKIKKEELLQYYVFSHPQVEEITARINEVDNELMRRAEQLRLRLEKHLEQTMNDIEILHQRQSALPSSVLDLSRLERDVKIEEDLFSLLKSKHQEVLIKEAEPIEEVTVIRMALSSQAVGKSKSPIIAAVAGGFLGFIFAGIWALGLETFGSQIQEINQVEAHTGVRLLTKLQETEGKTWDDVFRELSNEEASTSASLRNLRSILGFNMTVPEIKMLGVSSLEENESGDLFAVELAFSLANAGRRVLLVDARLTNPRLHDFFNLPLSPGLSELVSGASTFNGAVRGIPDLLMAGMTPEDMLAFQGVERLAILNAGERPFSAADFLATDKMEQSMSIIRDESLVAIFNLPPLIPQMGAQAMAPYLDGLAITCPPGALRAEAVKEAGKSWNAAGGRVLGCIWRTKAPKPEKYGNAKGRKIGWALAAALSAAAVAGSLWRQGRLFGWPP